MRYPIDADIASASTLEGRFYSDPEAYAACTERVFTRTWQWLGTLDDISVSGSLAPRDLLPDCLDEPLLLARDAGGTLRCLSNVCTHRGNILVTAPCHTSQIRCGYHSRRFDLDGRMVFMPEFMGVKEFPSRSDDLPQIPFGEWQGHGFAALDPAAPLEAFIGDITSRLAWLPVADFEPRPERRRDFDVAAHWALYVENYLEGFHIPFVHAGLHQVVDARGHQRPRAPGAKLVPGQVAHPEEEVVDAVRSPGAEARLELLQLGLHRDEDIRVHQLTELGVSQQLAELCLVDGERLRPAFR